MRPTHSPYRKLPLIDLIALIVEANDTGALDELHGNRPMFKNCQNKNLCIVDYLNELKNGVLGSKRNDWVSWETADRAFDQAVDKFINIPIESNNREASLGDHPPTLKQKGADCRLYYGAYLSYVRKQFEKRPPEGPIDEERRAALYLQRFVYRHFLLSLRDADRNANPFWSRYNWNIGGKNICVWLPVYLKGQERRRWLEKHIENPGPSKPRERQRIQAIINTKLKSMSLIPFDDAVTQQVKGDSLASGSSLETEFFRETLALTIADEKSDRICEQRRSIQKIGRDNLKRMILRIFEDMEAGDLHDHHVSKEFGLSKATYSRFAGSRWDQTGASIPDLWRNTAGVLAADPCFREAAKTAGVWHRVKIIVKNGGTR